MDQTIYYHTHSPPHRANRRPHTGATCGDACGDACGVRHARSPSGPLITPVRNCAAGEAEGGGDGWGSGSGVGGGGAGGGLPGTDFSRMSDEQILGSLKPDA